VRIADQSALASGTHPGNLRNFLVIAGNMLGIFNGGGFFQTTGFFPMISPGNSEKSLSCAD
jgi:hypothetical protein